MKQVKRRTWFCLLFTLILLLGLGIFLGRYLTHGADWASFSANKHLYDKSGHLASGAILDRNGNLLYDAGTNTYSDDSTVRKATLHAVGDKQGNIATGAVSAFRDHLGGFNPIFGTTLGGHDLYLTIDESLNSTAYSAMNGRKGTVGVYNYKTGEVLCMVSLPAFDPANPPQNIDGDSRYDGVYLNRFLSGVYPPGSTFKVVTAAAALEQLPDLKTRSFHCDGKTTVGGQTITCPKKHGDMTFADALARSCNGVFAALAAELGSDTMEKYAREAGLLDSQSVSGLTTAKGSYTKTEDTGNLGWSGVGQFEDMVNPCAMMTYMGTIANRGTRVTPRLLHKETTAAGLPTSLPHTEKDRGVMKEATCEELATMLRSNVTETYGQKQFGDLPVCAKSGTAEVGGGKRPHAWFTGFVDDEDLPLAFVVVVENGGSGAAAAGGVAAKVLAAAAVGDA